MTNVLTGKNAYASVGIGFRLGVRDSDLLYAGIFGGSAALSARNRKVPSGADGVINGAPVFDASGMTLTPQSSWLDLGIAEAKNLTAILVATLPSPTSGVVAESTIMLSSRPQSSVLGIEWGGSAPGIADNTRSILGMFGGYTDGSSNSSQGSNLNNTKVLTPQCYAAVWEEGVGRRQYNLTEGVSSSATDTKARVVNPANTIRLGSAVNPLDARRGVTKAHMLFLFGAALTAAEIAAVRTRLQPLGVYRGLAF